MYLRQAWFMAAIVRRSAGVNVPVVDTDAKGIWRYVKKSDWYSKPCWLHSGLLALPMIVAGRNASAALSVNLVFSLGVIVLIYLLGRRFYGTAGGLAAALFLAVSHYWLVYSRSFFAEVDAVFFVVLSFLLILQACNRRRPAVWIGAAGVAAALAVLCHYRLLFIVAPLGISVLMVAGNLRRIFWYGLLFGIAFMGVLAGVDLILRISGNLLGSGVPFSGLFGALAERYMPAGDSATVQTGWQPGNFLDYIRHIIRWQGIVCSVLVLPGICYLFKQRRTAGIALSAMLVLPLLVLTLQIWVVARAASVIVPFVCLAGGGGIAWIYLECNRRQAVWRYCGPILVTVLLAASAYGNGRQNLRLLGDCSGYPATVAWMKGHNVNSVYVLTETADMLGWYAPDLNTFPLRELIAGKVTEDVTVVLDGMRSQYYPESRKGIERFEKQLVKQGGLLFSTPNMPESWRSFLFDGTQAHSLNAMLKDMRKIEQSDLCTVRVYSYTSEVP